MPTSMWGAGSVKQLEEAHPLLRRIFDVVGRHWNAVILDVKRTPEEQRKFLAKGVSKTLESKHLPQADGMSHAVDSMPHPVSWEAVERGFAAVKRVDPKLEVLRAYAYQGFIAGVAAAQGVDVRQGIDWDSDEDFAEHTFLDIPHTELRSTQCSPPPTN